MADQDLIDTGQELVRYIVQQLQTGATADAIKASLAAQGWQEADIETALQEAANAMSGQSSQQTVQPAGPKKLLPLVVFSFLGIIVIGGGIFIFTGRSKRSASQMGGNISPTLIHPAASSSATILPSESASSKGMVTDTTTPSVRYDDDTQVYENSEHGYSFRFIKSWKIDTQGSLTVLTDTSSPKVTKSVSGIEILLNSDVAVSTVPYAGITLAPSVTMVGPTGAPNNQQVKDLATQLAEGGKPLATTINGLPGYVAVASSEGKFTYNVLLQGEKNMIHLMFAGKKSRLELNRGQTIVLESIAQL